LSAAKNPARPFDFAQGDNQELKTPVGGHDIALKDFEKIFFASLFTKISTLDYTEKKLVREYSVAFV